MENCMSTTMPSFQEIGWIADEIALQG